MTQLGSIPPQDAGDGTAQLLRWGGSTVAAGLFAALLLEVFFGGISRTGASTNAGWLAFIIALMCIPFGGLLLTLGLAKWFRIRRLARPGVAPPAK